MAKTKVELEEEIFVIVKDVVEEKLDKMAWFLDTNTEKVEELKNKDKKKLDKMIKKRENLQKALDLLNEAWTE